MEVGELAVAVEIVENAEAYNSGPFAAYHLRKAEPAAVAQRPEIRFTLPDGATVNFDKGRIQVGRAAEVLDDKRRLVRRNDLAIEHDTVSRGHAHIEFVDGAYRLFDDGSSYGTSVIHEGRLVDVPKAGARGQRLGSGDEIYFGQARVTIAFV
ncbi:MAG: FHA domain-containing protein [Bryobacteraceae bacterium]